MEKSTGGFPIWWELNKCYLFTVFLGAFSDTLVVVIFIVLPSFINALVSEAHHVVMSEVASSCLFLSLLPYVYSSQAVIAIACR